MPNPYLRAALAEQQKRRKATPKTSVAPAAVEKAAESADQPDTKPSTTKEK